MSLRYIWGVGKVQGKSFVPGFYCGQNDLSRWNHRGEGLLPWQPSSAVCACVEQVNRPSQCRKKRKERKLPQGYIWNSLWRFAGTPGWLAGHAFQDKAVPADSDSLPPLLPCPPSAPPPDPEFVVRKTRIKELTRATRLCLYDIGHSKNGGTCLWATTTSTWLQTGGRIDVVIQRQEAQL